MSARWTRRLAGSISAAGIFIAVLVAAEPAEASCMVPDLARVLELGRVVGVVSRLDDDEGRKGTFRVHQTVGGTLPAELTVDMPWNYSPQVIEDGLAALAFERKDGWELGWCATLDLGEVLQRTEGAAAVASKRSAVAIAAGTFGDSRLVSLDRAGKPVAWDRQGGTAERVAVCPGGKTVVAVGRPGGTYARGKEELSVHDARTLEPKRVVKLPIYKHNEIAALRCADPQGERVDIFVVEYHSDGWGHLFSVTDRKVSSVGGIGRSGAAAVLGDGFVAVVKGKVVRIASSGANRPIASLVNLRPRQLVVSPDQKTIAAYDGQRLNTVDPGTGERLGSLDITDVSGIAWTVSNRLLVRVGNGSGPVPNLRSFDRKLEHMGQGKAATGWKFAAVGEAGVNFDGVQMRVTPVGGPRKVLGEFRLGATEDLISLSGEGFDTDALALDVDVKIASEPNLEEAGPDPDESMLGPRAARCGSRHRGRCRGGRRRGRVRAAA